MKHQRAKNLTDQDVRTVVELLDGWTGKLTWPALCTSIARRLRQHYTRQALHSHEPIRQAFARRKEAGAALRREGASESNGAGDTKLAQLLAENAGLQVQLDAMRDKFVVWAYNAYAKGLSEAELSRPLPDVDRDRTDELKSLRTAKQKSKGKNG